MERLTVKRKDGRWALANSNGETPVEQVFKLPQAINRLAAFEDICFDSEGKEIISLDRLRKLVQAENGGQLVVLPFVAMVEQSLQGGQMKPQCDQRFNGRYAVVYLDKKKWSRPLIDICGTPYNDREAEERQKELSPKEAQTALAGKGEQ